MLSKQPVFVCSDCGRTIYNGEFYLDALNEQYCLGCALALFRYAEKLDNSVISNETE